MHRELTAGTLSDPEAAGQFQSPTEERVTVSDNMTGRIAHHPPPASTLPARMEALVRFANGDDEDEGTFVTCAWINRCRIGTPWHSITSFTGGRANGDAGGWLERPIRRARAPGHPGCARLHGRSQ